MGLYEDVEETYLYIADQLSRRGLAYVHFMDQLSRGSSPIPGISCKNFAATTMAR